MTNEPTEEVRVVGLDEAIPMLELVDVITYELRGRRCDGGFSDIDVDADDERDPGDDWDMQILARDGIEAVEIRAIMKKQTEEIAYTVDLAARYAKSEPFKIDKAEQGRFIDFLALPNLYPYIRQAVQDLSSRLGHPLTLELLRVGRSPVQLVGTTDEPIGSD